jgi:hypothetical protein
MVRSANSPKSIGGVRAANDVDGLRCVNCKGRARSAVVTLKSRSRGPNIHTVADPSVVLQIVSTVAAVRALLLDSVAAISCTVRFILSRPPCAKQNIRRWRSRLTRRFNSSLQCCASYRRPRRGNFGGRERIRVQQHTVDVTPRTEACNAPRMRASAAIWRANGVLVRSSVSLAESAERVTSRVQRPAEHGTSAAAPVFGRTDGSPSSGHRTILRG